MRNSRTLIKGAASILLALLVIVFFGRALKDSWASLSAHQFRISYPLVALSFLTVVAAGLLATYAWQITINSLRRDTQMTFSHSVAIVNMTSLTKYIPGKFWSYALQMYWLNEHGYAKSLVLYVGVVNLVVSMTSGMLLSLAFLACSARFALAITLPALVACLLAALLVLGFHHRVFETCVGLVNRYFKRNMTSYAIDLRTMLRIHGVHLLNQAASAVGACVLCFGIGYDLELRTVLLVMSALILSDTLGFIVFIAPAGLGVRESTMYFILGGAKAGSLALVLPLASRVVGLLADGLLGAVALKLLRDSVGPVRLSEDERG